MQQIIFSQTTHVDGVITLLCSIRSITGPKCLRRRLDTAEKGASFEGTVACKADLAARHYHHW